MISRGVEELLLVEEAGDCVSSRPFSLPCRDPGTASLRCRRWYLVSRLFMNSASPSPLPAVVSGFVDSRLAEAPEGIRLGSRADTGSGELGSNKLLLLLLGVTGATVLCLDAVSSEDRILLLLLPPTGCSLLPTRANTLAEALLLLLSSSSMTTLRLNSLGTLWWVARNSPPPLLPPRMDTYWPVGVEARLLPTNSVGMVTVLD